MTLDADLQNLTMIGSTPPGGRLVHREGRVFVEHASPLNGLMRRLRGEGRDRSVNTIRAVLQSVDERLVDMWNSRAENDPGYVADLAYRTRIILRALQQCTVGVRNLQATYVGDPSTTAAFELVSEKVASVLAKTENLQRIIG